MIKRIAPLLSLLLGLQSLYPFDAGADAFTATVDPSFQLDFPSPTADKPQSKLWFTDGCWWAILPRKSGPSLWQRTDQGWREHPEIARELSGVPGRVDVWPDGSGVIAVGLAELEKKNRSVTVFRLTRKVDGHDIRWVPRVLTELYAPSSDDAIETATLVRDSERRVWVAAVAGTKVCVWASSSEEAGWSNPVIVAEGVDRDDICVVTPLPQNQIGVIWSDQVREAVMMRTHADGTPVGNWRESEVVEIGNKTADDHLNTALSPDGTLWVASKDEVDTTGEPQFVMRVRSPDGQWTNHPYGIREETTRPSRPIVVATSDASIVFTGYGNNDRAVPFPHDSRIEFARVNAANPNVVSVPRAVIVPAGRHGSIVQNVTGPRQPYPRNVPWIVLASDPQGRVYEADLRSAFSDELEHQ